MNPHTRIPSTAVHRFGSPPHGCDGGRSARRRGRGFSTVEVLVGLVILMVGVLALASSISTAAKDMTAGRRDALLWSAVHQKTEELLAAGYSDLSSGSDSVDGFDLSWSVQGTEPKKLILVVMPADRWGLARPDTFVTYVMESAP